MFIVVGIFACRTNSCCALMFCASAARHGGLPCTVLKDRCQIREGALEHQRRIPSSFMPLTPTTITRGLGLGVFWACPSRHPVGEERRNRVTGSLPSTIRNFAESTGENYGRPIWGGHRTNLVKVTTRIRTRASMRTGRRGCLRRHRCGRPEPVRRCQGKVIPSTPSDCCVDLQSSGGWAG